MPISDAERSAIRRFHAMLKAGTPLAIAKQKTGLYRMKHAKGLSPEATRIIGELQTAHRIQAHLTP